MTDDARLDPGTAPYRGFLFSDMRGFTAFAERHGNAAAAEAVARFLDLARTAIARHEGAELKTEGDAIHAVFPTAASAVLCGLDIVDAAAELNEREPDRPLGLGVGVHTGEAVETAEGYIGSAVNVAARLCAAARPGEVLVSATVKAATQPTIPVGFITRGRQRLKGIREPVEIYAATRDLTARAAVVMPRLGMLLAAAGIVAVLAVAVVILAASVPAAPKASPAGPATPQPVAMGPLPIGTYSPQNFRPRFTFEISDPGWSANRDVPGLFGLVRESAPSGSVYFARVEEVITDPCVQGGEGPVGSGSGSPDVMAQLQALGHVDVADARVTQVGGWRGQQAEVTIAEGALAACGGLVGLEVGVFAAGGEIWSAASGERFRLLVVSKGEETVTIIISLDWTQSHSVQEQEELYSLASSLLTDVEF